MTPPESHDIAGCGVPMQACTDCDGEASQVGVVVLAADHGGVALKARLKTLLNNSGLDVRDLGAVEVNPNDDYPDLIAPLARAVASAEAWRGIAICGSGVGACIVANKIAGVRAALCGDTYTARKGVEDDDMNVLCIGARATGPALAWDLVQAFLAARFRDEDRFCRRLAKIDEIELSGSRCTARSLA
jgi:ribose 5-phosphate isomerase B